MTNVKTYTSNGLSPHLYPEYITHRRLLLCAAPRPGFPSRFLVAEGRGAVALLAYERDELRRTRSALPRTAIPRATFTGSRAASCSGRRAKQAAYAGYLASAFILPGGTRNNRVVAPGSEDLTGADGREARFFLVPVRPGTVYEQGATFMPAFQIDPVVPAPSHST